MTTSHRLSFFSRVAPEGGRNMISLSIRRKIMGIAVVLIVLMAVTAVLSMASVIQVGNQLDDLSGSYIPAYGDLARANIRSVERALELRRIVIDKTGTALGAWSRSKVRAFERKPSKTMEKSCESNTVCHSRPFVVHEAGIGADAASTGHVRASRDGIRNQGSVWCPPRPLGKGAGRVCDHDQFGRPWRPAW
jgi:hypothetical protein